MPGVSECRSIHHNACMESTLVASRRPPLWHILMTRLTLPLGVASLAAMGVLGLFAEQNERQGVGQSLTRAAARMAAALDANLDERNGNVALLASLPVVQRGQDVATMRETFDILLARQEAFAWIGRLDNDGQILAASGGLLQGQSGAQRPVFIEGRKGLFIGDVHEALLLAKLLPAPSDGEPLRFIDIARPVYRADGTQDGVLATHLSWSWVRSLFAQMLQDFDRVRGIELLVLSRGNVVLAGPAGSEGRLLELEGLFRPDAGQLARWSQATWPDGRDYVFAYADSPPNALVGQLGWRVLVRQPSELAFAPVRQLRLQMAALALLLTVGIGALAWGQARRVTRPLHDIARAAERIARGENEDIPRGAGVREVESLAVSLQHMVSTLTHRELALDRMHALAHRDTLTGLHNRRALELHMDLAAERAARSGECFAMLALDLDGFKPVNDQYGHAAGDALLREVAQRLADTIRASEMLARVGGDEFVVLLSAPAERLRSDAQAVAGRILASFDQPFAPLGHAVSVGCSIGIALGMEAVDSPQALLPRADQALYAAKRNGRGQIAWSGQGGALEAPVRTTP